MQSLREKVTFILSALVYLLFHLRVGADAVSTITATGWQILQTAPYAGGVTYLIIATLQYMSDGEKLPWDRQLRLFFGVGIIAGLIYGIYEYTQVPL